MKKTFTATFIVLALAVMAAVAFTGCGTSDAADGGETAGDGGGGGGNDGGGGEDTGGGGSTPVPASELCAKVTDWYCSIFVKCFPGVKSSDCGKLFPLDCANFAIDATKVDYDENKAGDCLAEMGNLACTGNPDEIAVCKEAIVGKVADGGDCSTGFDCADGLTCFYKDANSCGVCARDVSEDGDCSEAYCETALYCDDTQKCVKRPALGEACGTGDGAIPCVDSDSVAQLRCKPDSDGATTGTCVKMGVEGDTCASGEDCAFPYACLSDKCALKPRTTEACTYTVAAGAFQQEQYTACLYMSFFGGDWCKPGATEGEGTCTPVPAKDADCGKDNSLICATDLWCTDLAQGGTCQDKGSADDPCNPQYNGADCSSGVCKGTGVSGVCEGIECK